MRAAALIEVLEALGCGVTLDASGGGVTIDGDDPPPAALLALAAGMKAEMVHCLRTPRHWSKADWRAHFHERAAVLEYDAGLPRAVAEEEALEACFVMWGGRGCG